MASNIRSICNRARRGHPLSEMGISGKLSNMTGFKLVWYGSTCIMLTAISIPRQYIVKDWLANPLVFTLP